MKTQKLSANFIIGLVFLLQTTKISTGVLTSTESGTEQTVSEKLSSGFISIYTQDNTPQYVSSDSAEYESKLITQSTQHTQLATSMSQENTEHFSSNIATYYDKTTVWADGQTSTSGENSVSFDNTITYTNPTFISTRAFTKVKSTPVDMSTGIITTEANSNSGVEKSTRFVTTKENLISGVEKSTGFVTTEANSNPVDMSTGINTITYTNPTFISTRAFTKVKSTPVDMSTGIITTEANSNSGVEKSTRFVTTKENLISGVEKSTGFVATEANSNPVDMSTGINTITYTNPTFISTRALTKVKSPPVDISTGIITTEANSNSETRNIIYTPSISQNSSLSTSQEPAVIVNDQISQQQCKVIAISSTVGFSVVIGIVAFFLGMYCHSRLAAKRAYRYENNEKSAAQPFTEDSAYVELYQRNENKEKVTDKHLNSDEGLYASTTFFEEGAYMALNPAEIKDSGEKDKKKYVQQEQTYENTSFNTFLSK